MLGRKVIEGGHRGPGKGAAPSQYRGRGGRSLGVQAAWTASSAKGLWVKGHTSALGLSPAMELRFRGGGGELRAWKKATSPEILLQDLLLSHKRLPI